jgi:hypothetical protein
MDFWALHTQLKMEGAGFHLKHLKVQPFPKYRILQVQYIEFSMLPPPIGLLSSIIIELPWSNPEVFRVNLANNRNDAQCTSDPIIK